MKTTTKKNVKDRPPVGEAIGLICPHCGKPPIRILDSPRKKGDLIICNKCFKLSIFDVDNTKDIYLRALTPREFVALGPAKIFEIENRRDLMRWYPDHD
ncbi:MAG TPA: hypothetical protein VFG46_02235 [Chryseolinea sp.]|nr:hypothetical protein [Chryseolinea sp.]